MNSDAELVDRGIVRNVPVPAVGLLDQDRLAYCLVLFQVRQHMAEVSSAARFGGFQIGELLPDRKASTGGVITQETELRWNAKALLLLILARHPGIQHHLGCPRHHL